MSRAQPTAVVDLSTSPAGAAAVIPSPRDAAAAASGESTPFGRGMTVEQLTAAVFDSDAAPSDFNIFTHSLKDRFDCIFADVRARLPAVAMGEPSERTSCVTAIAVCFSLRVVELVSLPSPCKMFRGL